jgi:hypothetical protein
VGLCDEARERCAEIAAGARHVRIASTELDALTDPPPAALDPALHYLDGDAEAVTRFFLTLDTINFGSGWFPTLVKRPGHSGYETIAANLTEHFRTHGPWSNAELRGITATTVAAVLAQPPDHELMSLYGAALRDLGRWLGNDSATAPVRAADGSAERLASRLTDGMALFRDAPFYKRAQLLGSDLALAGVATFTDLDRLTIFADNVVPHVLRCDGVLVYDEELARLVDSGQLLEPGGAEREIRACALHACEQLAARYGLSERELDNVLWSRGRGAGYKARPRHRCRCVFY